MLDVSAIALSALAFVAGWLLGHPAGRRTGLALAQARVREPLIKLRWQLRQLNRLSADGRLIESHMRYRVSLLLRANRVQREEIERLQVADIPNDPHVFRLADEAPGGIKSGEGAPHA